VASIGICFAAALLALTFGYSVALGAFIAGSLVASRGRPTNRALDPTSARSLRRHFLRVGGMLLDPRVPGGTWPMVLALMAVVIPKGLCGNGGAFLAGNGLRPSIQAGMSLDQIGEFSFIIAGVGTAAGVVRPFLFPVARSRLRRSPRSRHRGYPRQRPGRALRRPKTP
jgi:CPA2 family monovalent cation:H+ antiporter-2